MRLPVLGLALEPPREGLAVPDGLPEVAAEAISFVGDLVGD
jgi:hypothetical protein